MTYTVAFANPGQHEQKTTTSLTEAFAAIGETPFTHQEVTITDDETGELIFQTVSAENLAERLLGERR